MSAVARSDTTSEITQRIRVRDARIATFGERVEDFFQITDEQDRALSADACAAPCVCADSATAIKPARKASGFQ